jgi:hypothetical protein
MILSGLLLMSMLLYFSPTVFALNRGNILRNIALWLGIFLALALIYQNFGPGSPHPLFNGPEGLSTKQDSEPKLTPPPVSDKKDDGDNGEQGFIPPKE